MQNVKKTYKEWAKMYGDLIMDPDGFDRKNTDKLYTNKEYKAKLPYCTIMIRDKQDDSN